MAEHFMSLSFYRAFIKHLPCDIVEICFAYWYIPPGIKCLELKRFGRHARRLTFLGPDGCGKSALARQMLALAHDKFSKVMCLTSPRRQHLWPGIDLLENLDEALICLSQHQDLLVIMDGVDPSWRNENLGVFIAMMFRSRSVTWILSTDPESLKCLRRFQQYLICWTSDYVPLDVRLSPDRSTLSKLWAVYGEPPPLLVIDELFPDTNMYLC